jgi:DNA-binding IscR family transcriptional regulator
LTLGDVVTALEGPVAPQEFVHVPESDAEGTDWWAACAVRNAWHAAAEASQRVLDNTTIQRLVEQQRLIRAQRQQGAPPAGPPAAGRARESAAIGPR